MFCLLMYLLINLIIATMLWQPTFKWLEIKIISPIENVEKNYESEDMEYSPFFYKLEVFLIDFSCCLD